MIAKKLGEILVEKEFLEGNILPIFAIIPTSSTLLRSGNKELSNLY